VATDLDAVFRFVARSAPDGRDAAIIALGAHVGRSSTSIPTDYQPAWMFMATIAIFLGFLLMITRSFRAPRST
jgi:hypothetical protein